MSDELEAVQDNEYIKTYNDHEDWVYGVSWSFRGLASAGNDQQIIVYGNTGDIDRIFEAVSPVFCVQWSPDLATLISGHADGSIGVWDVEEETAIRRLSEHTDAVRSIAWESRGTRFASASQDGHIKVWKANGTTSINTFSFPSAVLCVAWVPKSRSQLIVGGDGGLLEIVNVDKGKMSPLLATTSKDEGVSGDVLAIAWISDQVIVAGTSEGDMVFVDVKQRATTKKVHAHNDWVTCIVWSRELKKIATCGFNEDPTIKLWDAHGSLIGSFEGHKLGLNAIAWSTDCKRIASASTDNTVRLWDTADVMSDDLRKSRIGSGHEESCRACRWSPDGSLVASGSDDKSVRIWTTENGQRKGTFREIHTDWVNSIAWNPASTKLVTGCGDGKVRILDVEKMEVVHTLEGHEDWVECVAWCSDGLHVASGSFEQDAAVIIWDANSGSSVHNCRGHSDRVQDVDFHPDGNVLISASYDATVMAWDVTDGDCIKTFHLKSSVNCARFSHTGALVAAGCNNGTLSVYEYFTGDLLHCFKCHDHWIYCIGWSPMDTHILTGSEDKTVRVIELMDGDSGSLSDFGGSFSTSASPSRKNTLIDENDVATPSKKTDVLECTEPPGMSGFYLDSPVFCVSWHEEEGVICSCASGRLVHLSVTIKRGRKSVLAWQQSFRKTAMFPRFSALSDMDGDEDDGDTTVHGDSDSDSDIIDYKPEMIVHEPVLVSEADLRVDPNAKGRASRRRNGPKNAAQSSFCTVL